MRVAVVDTDILVSGLMRPDGPPAVVVDDIVRRRLQPVVCSAIMAEYTAVLARPRLRLPSNEVDAFIATLAGLTTWVQVPDYTGSPPLPDAADWPFIACAMATGSEVITGNARHFPAELGIRVVTAREWAQRRSTGW